ncbi:MAG: hypothetical protein IKG81_12435 [Bacteroidales bacterium]|nr:hypothetical protein [Bacteroidales bacterium]
MNENKKNNYTAPAVKVVAFQVEQGFAGSDPVSVGVTSEQITDLHPNVEQGTETFFTRTL